MPAFPEMVSAMLLQHIATNTGLTHEHWYVAEYGVKLDFSLLTHKISPNEGSLPGSVLIKQASRRFYPKVMCAQL